MSRPSEFYILVGEIRMQGSVIGSNGELELQVLQRAQEGVSRGRGI